MRTASVNHLGTHQKANATLDMSRRNWWLLYYGSNFHCSGLGNPGRVPIEKGVSLRIPFWAKVLSSQFQALDPQETRELKKVSRGRSWDRVIARCEASSGYCRLTSQEWIRGQSVIKMHIYLDIVPRIRVPVLTLCLSVDCCLYLL